MKKFAATRSPGFRPIRKFILAPSPIFIIAYGIEQNYAAHPTELEFSDFGSGCSGANYSLLVLSLSSFVLKKSYISLLLKRMKWRINLVCKKSDLVASPSGGSSDPPRTLVCRPIPLHSSEPSAPPPSHPPRLARLPVISPSASLLFLRKTLTHSSHVRRLPPAPRWGGRSSSSAATPRLGRHHRRAQVAASASFPSASRLRLLLPLRKPHPPPLPLCAKPPPHDVASFTSWSALEAPSACQGAGTEGTSDGQQAGTEGELLRTGTKDDNVGSSTAVGST
jgi:hypothetical protein